MNASSLDDPHNGQPDYERKRRVLAAMNKSGLDLLICSLPMNVLLLTGYWPVIGTCVAAVLRDGPVVLFVPQDEQHQLQGCFADRIENFHPSSLDELRDASQAIKEPLSKLLGKFASAQLRIGYEADAIVDPASYVAMYLYCSDLNRTLAAVLPNAKLTSACEVLSELRSVLTPQEVSRVRRACEVAAVAYQHGASSLRPGLTELEAAANFRIPLSTVDVTPGARADGFVYCMAGLNSARAFRAYARSSANKLRPRDLVLVHCNSYVDGFWTDITRTYCLGQPNEQQHRMFEAVAEASRAAFAVIHPGAKASDVDLAARQELSRYGFMKDFKHQTGHGVAYSAIDHAAPPRLHPKSPDILSAGMVFNIEPAIYISGLGGIRHCDLAVVTAAGAELLTDFQMSPELLEAA